MKMVSHKQRTYFINNDEETEQGQFIAWRAVSS